MTETHSRYAQLTLNFIALLHALDQSGSTSGRHCYWIQMLFCILWYMQVSVDGSSIYHGMSECLQFFLSREAD